MTHFRLIKIICLSLSLFLLGSLSIFASSDTVSPSVSEEAPFTWVDLEQATIMKGAQDIKAVTATTYSVDDIYNLLYSALRGSASSTTYSLPYIANRTASIYTRLGSMQTNDITTQGIIQDIADDVHTALFGDSTYAMGTIAQLIDMLDIEAGNTSYTVTELTGMIWSIVQNIESDLATLQTLSNQATQQLFETQRTNAKLEYVFSAIEDTINIKWYNSAHTYNGTSLSLSNSYLDANNSSRIMYVSYDFNDTVTPQLYRITIPLRFLNPYSGDVSQSISLTHAYVTLNYTDYYEIPLPSEYFIEPTINGIYLYLFNWQPYGSTYHYFFQFESLRNLQYRTSYGADVVVIPFDTLDYQIIRTAFNQAKSAMSLSELDTIASTLGSLLSSVQSSDSAVNSLADYIVSPEKQAAEDASQPVINETLDNFTGSGSSAPKVSDVQNLSSVSSSIREFATDPDATIGDGLSIFSFGNELYNFFSRTTYNNLRTIGTNNRDTKSIGCYGRTSDNDEEVIDFVQQNLDYWEAYKHK